MWKRILRHKIISLIGAGSAALAIAGTLWTYFALRHAANGPLILHFDDLQGITSVGSFGSLLLVGMLGVAIVIMNSAIALELENRDRILGKILIAFTAIFAILLFLGFSAILNVN